MLNLLNMLLMLFICSSVWAIELNEFDTFFVKINHTPPKKIIDQYCEKYNNNFRKIEEKLKKNASKKIDDQYLLGYFYLHFNEQLKGIKKLEYVAKSGYLPAKLVLLKYYTSSNKEKQNFSRAVELAKEIEKDIPQASFEFLGIAFYQDKQFEKAEKNFLKATKFNSVLAFRFLGTMYLFGIGDKKDYNMGKQYLTKAAENGDSIACLNLSKYYMLLAKNEIKLGKFYLEKAGNLDNPVANYYLGYYHSMGRFYEKNLRKAFEYYNKSAKAYYEPGCFRVGQMYFQGYGVKRSLEKAFKYFSSIAFSSPEGRIIIIRFILDHFDIVENQKKYLHQLELWLEMAIKTYKKYEAYYLLGIMYFEGKGKAKNEKKALSMFKKACEKFNPELFGDIAYYLAQKGKYLETAVELIKQINQKNNFTDIYGYILFKQGKYKQALNQLLKANRLFPQTPEILDHLGDVYFALGKGKAAKKYWEEAILVAKDDKELLRKLRMKLKKIEARPVKN